MTPDSIQRLRTKKPGRRSIWPPTSSARPVMARGGARRKDRSRFHGRGAIAKIAVGGIATRTAIVSPSPYTDAPLRSPFSGRSDCHRPEVKRLELVRNGASRQMPAFGGKPDVLRPWGVEDAVRGLQQLFTTKSPPALVSRRRAPAGASIGAGSRRWAVAGGARQSSGSA